MSRFRWGLQLPVQAQSPTFVQPWESAATPDDLVDIAVAADDAGSDYIAVCDHIAVPNDRVADLGATWFDTVGTLAWLGARTRSVRLMSHVYVLPYRSQYVTAKQFATLDALSGGRAVLGAGAGHVAEEFELLGIPFDGRGARFDSVIGELRELWRHGGDGAASVAPRSPRPNGPPILIGGSSPRALRRAAELGDGWLPQQVPAQGFRAALAEMRDAVAARPPVSDHPFEAHVHLESMRIVDDPQSAGARQAAERGAFVGTEDRVAERIGRYIGLGADVHQARFDAASAADLCDQIGRFAGVVGALT